MNVIQKIIKNKYSNNVVWQIVGFAINLVSALIVGGYVASYLGVEQFGLIATLTVVTAISSHFISLGINQVLVSDLIKGNIERSSIFWTAFLLRVLLAVIVYVVLVLAWKLGLNWSLAQSNLTYALIGFFPLLALPFSTSQAIYDEKIQNKYTVQINCLVNLVSAVVRVYLVMKGATLLCFIAELSLKAAIMPILYFLLLKKLTWLPAFKSPDWRYLRILAHKAFPLMLSALSVILFTKIDILMIGKMMGTVDVGVYAVAIRFSDIFHGVSGIIVGTMYPALVKGLESTEFETRMVLGDFLKLTSLIAYGCVIVGIAFSYPVISLFFSSEFYGARPIVFILLLAMPVVFQGGIRAYYYISTNDTKSHLITTFSGLVINVALNLVIIPLCGLYGAALASVVSIFIAAWLSGLLLTSRWIVLLQAKSFYPHISVKRVKKYFN